jgi:hypothetical protein
MWLIVSVVYVAFKWLTFLTASTVGVPAWRKWAYLFAWPGMNARRFLATCPSPGPPRPAASEWLEGFVNAIAGAIVFWTAHLWIAISSPILFGWAGMLGTILLLHFGIFQLISCIWRHAGVDAPPLMNHPTRSSSVAEFWGRRWNTAFRDVAHQFIFRPLVLRSGATVALIAGFAFSGVVHEMVISLPAGGAYGGPFVFFCIQAAAVLFERSRPGQFLRLGRGWRGWLFTCLVLLLPVRLLFHDAFVLRVVVPFMQSLGAA